MSEYDDASDAGVDDALPSLPSALADQLPSVTVAEFHSASASRLLLFSGAADDGAVSFDFQWDVIVGQMSQLLHGWHTIFAQLQTAARTMDPRLNSAASIDEWHLHLLSVSRSYRAELESCLLVAAQQIQPGSGEVKAELRQELASSNISVDDYKFQLLLLETCKSLFHLLEIFYLDPHLNLTSQLIDWIHRTLQLPEVVPSEEEAGGTEFDPTVMQDTDAYWNCVYQMLLQGRLFEASQMLASCAELNDASSPYADVMRQVIGAIETVPAIAYRESSQDRRAAVSKATSIDASENIPLEQFLHSFHAWRDHVDGIRNGETLANSPHPHLDLLLLVLLGDESSLLTCAASNYLEYFIATLIYVKPHVQNSKREMADILKRCMEQCESQWREERQAARDQMADEDEEDDADSLYTPIDTLRYHLISSDISAALAAMNTMLDLRFFMAHVVNLLDAHGEIIHLEPQRDGPPLPLRFDHSSIGDNVTLKEHYLISYGENLEAASAGAGASPGNEDLWQLAVEYYAACREHGRGYLTQLLRRQCLTATITTPATVPAPGTSAFSSVGSSSRTQQRLVQTKKVHKLLAVASRYQLQEEYNHILEMAGRACFELGRDAIAAAATATSADQAPIGSWFGQAAFWYAMLQPTVDGASVSHLAVAKLESLAEHLLDHLLLRGATLAPRQQAIAEHAVVGLLAHVPAQILLPIESIDARTDFAAVGASPLLSFLAAYHSFSLFAAQRRRAARDVQAEKQRLVDAAAAGEEDMDDTHAGPQAALNQLIEVHTYLRSQALSLLVQMVRQAPLLLAAQRKYWLVLLAAVVQLADERALGRAAVSGDGEQEGTSTICWFDLHHPSVALPTTQPAEAASPLTLAAITHAQRLLTSLAHSNTADLYAKAIGGPAATKRLQQRLTALTQQCIATA